MGSYNDIWTRVKEFENAKKETRRKAREEKTKEVASKITKNACTPILDDPDLTGASYGDKVIEQTTTLLPIDYRIIKVYDVPPFVPGEPNLSQPAALQKYKNPSSRYSSFG